MRRQKHLYSYKHKTVSVLCYAMLPLSFHVFRAYSSIRLVTVQAMDILLLHMLLWLLPA